MESRLSKNGVIFRQAMQVLRGIYLEGVVGGDDHLDLVAVLEGPELFEFLGGFPGAGGQAGKSLKEFPPLGINAPLMVIGGTGLTGRWKDKR